MRAFCISMTRMKFVLKGKLITDILKEETIQNIQVEKD